MYIFEHVKVFFVGRRKIKLAQRDYHTGIAFLPRPMQVVVKNGLRSNLGIES